MNRRGFTLIELLLAISLVLIVGGLVLPSIFTSLGERSFESAAEVVRSQLLLARAHAQVTHRPVEVLYQNRPPRKPGIRARYFLVNAPEPAERDATDAALLPVDEQEIDPDQVIVEGWADRDLPDGLQVIDRADVDAAAGLAAPAPTAGEDAPALVRLAVYMPDGSAPLASRVWLYDDHGRRGAIEVNPWTGLPSFDRLGPEDETTADEEVEEPEPEAPVDDFRAPETPPPPADAAPDDIAPADAGPAPAEETDADQDEDREPQP